MSYHRKSQRYFQNPFSDYDGKDILIDKEFWSNYLSEIALECVKRTKLKADTCDGGLYVGNLGVVFMIHKLLTSGYCKNHEKELKKYIHAAIELNEQYYTKNISKSEVTSLLLGRCGFYMIASLASKDFYDDELTCLKFAKEYENASKLSEKVSYLSHGSDELFVGRAGILCGILFYKQKLGIEVVNEQNLYKILDAMIESGRKYAEHYGPDYPSPLMYAYHRTEYLGAAHGLSSILQMILSFPKYLESRVDVQTDVQKCLDFLLSIQSKNGNFPSSTDELSGNSRHENDELIHWCHGASGVIWCIAKAYLIWHEEKYLNSCIKMGELVWNYGLLRKGPGICHGIGGNGYVHLLLYRLTNDKKYLYRAVKFAEFLVSDKFKNEARTPDNPYSLYEGLSGTVCFLIDLLQPENAIFPLFNIFV